MRPLATSWPPEWRTAAPNGAAQEFFPIPAEKVLKLPASMTLDQAAIVEPVSVGVHAIRRAGGVEGKGVLVLGAGTIGNLFLFGLPPDYYEGLPKRVDAMTAGEVFEATKAHLSPDAMKVIAVGDRRVIDRQIAVLKLGPIGYRLADGRPVDAAGKVALPTP